MTPQTPLDIDADTEPDVPSGLAERLSFHHVHTLKRKALRGEIRAVITSSGRWLFDRRELLALAAKRRHVSANKAA